MRAFKKGKSMLLLLLFICLLSGCSLDEWGETADVVKHTVKKDTSQVESISQEEYVYQTLDEKTQRVYDEVLNAILEQEETVAVSADSKEELDLAYNAVNADYGGLFWVSGYMYTQHALGDNIIGIEFSPTYIMEKEEREQIQKQIDDRVEEILAGISVSDPDFNKVKYVFETLIKQVDYDPDAENNQNIISVFLNGKTVCQGYACATQYLLDLLNVQSAVVTGKADGEPHAWNLVKMDGEYYYVDTTWGNSRYLNEGKNEEKYVNYNYLGMNSEEISTSHQAESAFELPECVASEDNYYVHEGLYFDKWDPDAIGEIFHQAWESGQKKVSVKFSTQELYEKAYRFFIKEEQIADYCDGITTMYYIEDKEQKILSISF